jgi:hypothetical protein
MATGAAPFANLSPNQIVITVGVHKKSPDIPTSLPPALQTLLASCLSVDPAARPRALQALQVGGLGGRGLFATVVNRLAATGWPRWQVKAVELTTLRLLCYFQSASSTAARTLKHWCHSLHSMNFIESDLSLLEMLCL